MQTLFTFLLIVSVVISGLAQVLVKKAEPAVAFSEKDVVFLFKKDLGLIELVEK